MGKALHGDRGLENVVRRVLRRWGSRVLRHNRHVYVAHLRGTQGEEQVSEQEIEALVRRMVGKVSTWKIAAGIFVGILSGGFAAGQFWAGKGARDDAQDAKILTIQTSLNRMEDVQDKIYDLLLSRKQ